MTIEHLQPVPQRLARNALAEFIHFAQFECAAFGSDLDWKRPDWDVTNYCPFHSNNSHKKSIIYFTTHEGGTSKSMAGRTALGEPFCSLMKAIVRTRQEGNPQTGNPLSRIVNASRDLELELANRSFDPCLLVPGDFSAAARRIAKRATGTTKYRLGQALQLIADTIDEHGIAFVRLDWRNPFSRKANNGSRESAVAVKAREDKMPDEEILDALSSIWNEIDNDSDAVLMGCITLLHCAPWRIVEVLRLHKDCEVIEERAGPIRPGSGHHDKPLLRYGLRYFKEKSTEPDIKWIPTVMIDTAKSAIARIRDATEPARRVAQWLNRNPGRAWLPGPDADPGTEYDLAQVASLVGVKDRGSANAWLRARDVPMRPVGLPSGKPGKRFLVTREAIEQALVLQQRSFDAGPGEPALHDRLFVSFRYAHAQGRQTSNCLVELVYDQQISDFLGGRQSVVRSGFDRILDQPQLKARTHQLRHWLNTLSQAAGLEQGLIARWSGRDDEAQNSEYDHLPPAMLAEHARNLVAEGNAIGPLADIDLSLPLADRDTYRETVIETAHVTDIGICLQSWITSPCPEYGACPTCEATAIIKGNMAADQRAQQLRDDNQWIADRLEAEIDDGTRGASQHLAATTAVIGALDKVLAIHRDPTIPDGTLVQPNLASPVHYGGQAIESANGNG
ncbi:hypothetical protein [Novosphingobium resinovorum]|uniref:hypothetical protein n=1 Tax=Novosphingobium resinovorum TaxID=158500 RepID=UPI002ECFE0D2|nr:hypothetical protein [Novosphingobium resinovorum]